MLYVLTYLFIWHEIHIIIGSLLNIFVTFWFKIIQLLLWLCNSYLNCISKALSHQNEHPQLFISLHRIPSYRLPPIIIFDLYKECISIAVAELSPKFLEYIFQLLQLLLLLRIPNHILFKCTPTYKALADINILIVSPLSSFAEPPRQVEKKGAATEDGLHRNEQSFHESRPSTRSPVPLASIHRESAGQRWQLDQLPDHSLRADPFQSVIAGQQSVWHIQQPPVRNLCAREPGLSHATALWIRKSFPRRRWWCGRGSTHQRRSIVAS